MEEGMKWPVAILAGGRGTRLQEETVVKPKPMVEIGDKPILWHIMKTYAAYGFHEFVIALGYKGEYIREYFSHSVDPGWKVHLLDTGEDTETGGRVRQVLEFTQTGTFLTYGDGLANIHIPSLLKFHQANGVWATITAVNPPARFGRIKFGLDGVIISGFDEKPVLGYDYINGGFMVVEPEVLSTDMSNKDVFEKSSLPQLANAGMLAGYIHEGFWQCMDTLREKEMLNELWNNGDAPWKVWDD